MKAVSKELSYKKTLQTYLKTCQSNSVWQKRTGQYMSLSPEEKATHYNQLIDILKKHGSQTLFRGTMGNMELQHAVDTGRLGQDFGCGGKSLSFDLPAYIRENGSAYFLSASECPITAKPYASGCFTKLPRRGFVIALGMPKVFTTPNKVLKINPKAFAAYDDIKLQDEFCIENGGTKYTPIADMTRKNNETTLVLTNYRATKNWRPKICTDIHQIIEVCGPGKFLGSMMSFSQPILLSELTNPNFKKRQWSLEVFLDCGNDPEIIEAAILNNILEPENRLLTLADADAIDDSGILDNYIDADSDHHDTIQLNQVPSDIPIGDQNQLVEYMEENLQQRYKTTSMPQKMQSMLALEVISHGANEILTAEPRGWGFA